MELCRRLIALHALWPNLTAELPAPFSPAGQLNYLGSSHQVWHILAVVMLYWWHQSTVYIMQYRHSKPCPEYGVDL